MMAEVFKESKERGYLMEEWMIQQMLVEVEFNESMRQFSR